MEPLLKQDSAFEFISGHGEMAERIRNFNWSKTPLGKPNTWSPTLKSVISLMIVNRFPQLLWWGEDYIQFYNDPYIPIPGLKHPKALGQSGHECWEEIWDVLRPLVDTPFKGGPSTWMDDILLEINRSNFVEETHFTIAYSPVPDPNAPGGIGGVLATVNEITTDIINKRALDTLGRVSSFTSGATSLHEVFNKASEALNENQSDFPFAIFYLLDEKESGAVLCASSGIREGDPGAPHEVDFSLDAKDQWPIGSAIEKKDPVVLNDLEKRFGSLPTGTWRVPPNQAILIPIAVQGKKPIAVLIAGINPFRKLDNSYASFLRLIAEQVTQALSNVEAIEAERKRVEALQQLDRAKTVFFSNISHEFRTPLTLLLGIVEELMVDPGNSAKTAERLNMTHRNAMRLLKLVNTLLDFSRIESGRQHATYAPADIALLTKNLAGNFRSVIEKAGLIFAVEVDAIKQLVYVDRHMWEKIVFNLLSNAFKYTLDGSITLRLFAENDSMVLEVIDTGVGIPENELPHMFERFHRVQNIVGRTYEGTGIGLSLIKEMVQLHGGTISVNSKVGQGSKFIVNIPFGTEHLPAHQVSEKVSEFSDVLPGLYTEEANSLLEYPGTSFDSPQDVTKNNGETPLILVVEDNPDMRQHIQSLLATRYRVITAPNGFEALQKIHSESPKLVLSDIMMPTMDGIQLLKEIKTNSKTSLLPVILLTARAGEESKVEGYEMGADDYLIKPFSAKELIARVQAQISIANKRAEAEERMNGFLMQAPAAIAIVKGPDHIFSMANSLFQNISGRTSQQLIGHGLKDAFPEVEGQGIFELFEQIDKTGESYTAHEFPVTLMDSGVPRQGYYDFVLHPIRSSNGTINDVMIHAVETTKSVEARKKIESINSELEENVRNRTEELSTKNAQLQEQNYIIIQALEELKDRALKDEKKDEFISIASHELKTPLTSAKGYIQLAESLIAETGNNNLILILSRANISLDRLSNLIHDLLDVTRIQHGRLEINYSAFDFSEIVKESIEFIQQTSGKHSIVAEGIDRVLTLNGDKERLLQVCLNILSNAIKYSPEGSTITINVGTTKTDLVMSVADRGIGISKEELPHVFERYFRAQKIGARYQGIGIGLFLAEQIIELHHGKIWVESEEAKGSTFFFSVPLEEGR